MTKDSLDNGATTPQELEASSGIARKGCAAQASDAWDLTGLSGAVGSPATVS